MIKIPRLAPLYDSIEINVNSLPGSNLSHKEFTFGAFNCLMMHECNLFYTKFHWCNLSCTNMRKAQAHGSEFLDCRLWYIRFKDANLTYASFSNCTMNGASFSGANLANSEFYDCDLNGANFQGAILNWSSHCVISQILLYHAGNSPSKRAFAAMVGYSTDWCWPQFRKINNRRKEWAAEVLADYCHPGNPKCKAPHDILAIRLKRDKEKAEAAEAHGSKLVSPNDAAAFVDSISHLLP